MAEEVVAEADCKTGEAKCIYYRSRFTYLYDDQVGRYTLDIWKHLMTYWKPKTFMVLFSGCWSHEFKVFVYMSITWIYFGRFDSVVKI